MTHTGEISHRCPDCVNSYAPSTLASPDRTFAESDHSSDALNVERPCSSAATDDLHKQEQTDTTRGHSESPSLDPVDNITSDEVTSENKAQSREGSPSAVPEDFGQISVDKGECSLCFKTATL